VGSFPISAGTRTSLEGEHGFSLTAVFCRIERRDGRGPGSKVVLPFMLLAIPGSSIRGLGSTKDIQAVEALAF
jgi:hypothetical protein